MKVFAVPASPPCSIVYATVYQLGLEDQVTFQHIDFKAGDHKTEEFLALNPLGQIPTLKDGHFGLGEATAIQSYILAKTKYEGSFVPHDLHERAKMMQICSFEMTTLRNSAVALYFSEIIGPLLYGKPKADEAHLATLIENLEKDLTKMVAFIKHNGGDYLTGHHFTLGDSNCFAYVSLAVHNGLYKLDKFPELEKWYGLCSD